MQNFSSTPINQRAQTFRVNGKVAFEAESIGNLSINPKRPLP